MSKTPCKWFALCDQPATTTLPHSILGDVPVCARCAAKVQRIAGKTNPAQTALKITTRLVDAALASGYLVSVNDGEETTVSKSANRADIIAAMASTDLDVLTFWKSKAAPIGSVTLIYENGEDVISDSSEPRLEFDDGGNVVSALNALIETAQGNAPITRTYRLGSSEMVGAPGIVAWAINGAKFKKDRAQCVNVVASTWGISEAAASALVTGAVSYTIEDGTVIFTV